MDPEGGRGAQEPLVGPGRLRLHLPFCVCVFGSVYVCACVCVGLYMSVGLYMRVCVCLDVCICVCFCLCSCVCIQLNVFFLEGWRASVLNVRITAHAQCHANVPSVLSVLSAKLCAKY